MKKFLLLALFVLPFSANAQTVADIQAQINAVMAQIAILQSPVVQIDEKSEVEELREENKRLRNQVEFYKGQSSCDAFSTRSSDRDDNDDDNEELIEAIDEARGFLLNHSDTIDSKLDIIVVKSDSCTASFVRDFNEMMVDITELIYGHTYGVDTHILEDCSSSEATDTYKYLKYLKSKYE